MSQFRAADFHSQILMPLLENTSVRTTTLVVAVLTVIGMIGGLIGFAVAESTWRTNITRDIKDLRVEVKALGERIVGRGPSGWHKRDMQLWVSELGRSNPDLTVPPARNEFD